MDALTMFARTVQIATLFLAVYTAYLALRRLPLISHLRFRADHIYYAIVLILILTFGLIYLCALSLTSLIKYHWWVVSLDRIIQLALFIGILNCACGCSSGEHHEHDNTNVPN